MKLKLKRHSNVRYNGQSNKSYIGKRKELISDYVKTTLKEETKEERVLRILKGDFENKFGMSFDEFQEIYQEILKNNPEKLI